MIIEHLQSPVITSWKAEHKNINIFTALTKALPLLGYYAYIPTINIFVFKKYSFNFEPGKISKYLNHLLTVRCRGDSWYFLCIMIELK